jgi:acyl carrier protein phosphodiesterase
LQPPALFYAMNFLAHLYLSGNNPDLLLGNFLGDLVRNRDLPALPVAVQEGVRLHRFIDSYTDQHPMVRLGTTRLRPLHGKYAPVVLDVLYDFVLSQNWDRYHSESLEDFRAGVYRQLLERKALVPGRLQERLELMVADDWLRHYSSEEGLQAVFERMKRRVSRPDLLTNATHTLLMHYSEFEAEFNVFFPELRKLVVSS